MRALIGQTLAMTVGALAFAGGTLAIVAGLAAMLISEELAGLFVGAFLALWITLIFTPVALCLSAVMAVVERRGGTPPIWAYLVLGAASGLAVAIFLFWDNLWAPALGPLVGLAGGWGAIKGRDWL